MLGRRKAPKKTIINTKDPAAIKLQCLVRVFLAKARIRHQARRVWQRVYDPLYKKYFFFNHLDGTSRWTQPMFASLFEQDDHDAAVQIERLARGFVGRMRARKLANQKYTRFYDSNLNKFYWLDKTTNETTWTVSNWLYQQKIDMPPEDSMLFESQQKIRELEEKLKQKEDEIKQVRKARYEELEPDVIKDKVRNAKSFKRSKDMDLWKTDELAAWFVELKMDFIVDYLFKNRVDGLLFVNLEDHEWEDMGITSKVHIRKLQLIMKSFRVRYQRKKDRIEVDDDDDLLSEVSPSELSALLAAEDAAQDDFSESSSDDDDSYDSEEELRQEMTDEQRLQKQLDQQNIKIEVMVQGDAVNFPMIGDIVRVRYVATLQENDKVVMSTKNVLGRAWVEFVLGIDQVIKGFDRALPRMSVGERSKLIITPEYGYGTEGLSPHIPPNATLCFDITLLGFRPRSEWVKPLLQDQTTNEKPYHDDLKIAISLAQKGESGTSAVINQQLISMVSGGWGQGSAGAVAGTGTGLHRGPGGTRSIVGSIGPAADASSIPGLAGNRNSMRSSIGGI